VAAESSLPAGEEVSDGDLRRAIVQLPAVERDAFLLRLARGEPHLSLALRRRLGLLGAMSQGESARRRTVAELLATAEARRETLRRELAAAAEAKRLTELEALARREDETWLYIDVLIQRTQVKAYDEAVELLRKLGDLAEYQGRYSAFEEHLYQICDQYRRRPALMGRLRDAGLIGP